MAFEEELSISFHYCLVSRPLEGPASPNFNSFLKVVVDPFYLLYAGLDCQIVVPNTDFIDRHIVVTHAADRVLPMGMSPLLSFHLLRLP